MQNYDVEFIPSYGPKEEILAELDPQFNSLVIDHNKHSKTRFKRDKAYGGYLLPRHSETRRGVVNDEVFRGAENRHGSKYFL